ncbi:MAG: hypothetical protein AAGA25_12880 [Planctomycetota bacterium]
MTHRKLDGDWMGWAMLFLWLFGTMWSFAVVPWFHAQTLLGDEMTPPGRDLIGRWFRSAVAGIIFAVFPIAGLTIADYVLTNGFVYTPYWGWLEIVLVSVIAYVLLGTVVLVFFRRRFKDNVRKMYAVNEYCFGCGYSLHGLKPGPCPECGHAGPTPSDSR